MYTRLIGRNIDGKALYKAVRAIKGTERIGDFISSKLKISTSTFYKIVHNNRIKDDTTYEKLKVNGKAVGLDISEMLMVEAS